MKIRKVNCSDVVDIPVDDITRCKDKASEKNLDKT